MAASIIGGLLTSGVDARQLRAGDPSQESLDRLASLGPITTSQDNLNIIPGCDVLVMAVKPQLMKVVCAGIADTVQANKPLIISIAAGVTSDSLNQWLGGNLAIVRCMPNTPALLRCGATGLFANTAVSEIQRQQAQQILDAVGLARNSLDRLPHQFSGGQRQRIGIARALIVRPKLVICDEPVSALDVSTQAQILNLLVELREAFDLSYLFISHDLSVVRYFSDRVLVMHDAHIVEQATPHRLWQDPQHRYTQRLLAAIPGHRQPSIPLSSSLSFAVAC